MEDTLGKIAKTTPRRREVNVIVSLAEALKPILEQLVGINQQLANISQQFSSRQSQKAASVEQGTVKAKVIDTQINSNETERINMDLNQLFKDFTEDTSANIGDGGKSAPVPEMAKIPSCCWTLRLRPERKRVKTGSLSLWRRRRT